MILLFLFLMALPQALDSESPPTFIVWNVGQGQWVTYIKSYYCAHFDMGGEDAPWEKIKLHCKNKKNYLFLSHSDEDHISFIRKASHHLPHLCLAQKPTDPKSNEKKHKWSFLTVCPPPAFLLIENLPLNLRGLSDAQKKKINTYSSVHLIQEQFLVSGDSPSSMEKRWRHHLSHPSKVKVLTGGHHGSQTSSSIELFQSLKGLRQVIFSARRSRFGHPHSEVLKRVRQFKVAPISSENWGHIFIRE